jgi:hypothetical protein
VTEDATGERREIDARDEAPHEHGGARGWSERIAFWFFDRGSGLGGRAWMEFWPGERRAESAVWLFLSDGRFATAVARAHDASRKELTVGRLAFEIVESLAKVRMTCRDTALVFPTAQSAALSRAGERPASAAQLDLDLRFERLGEPAGWRARRAEVNDQRFMTVVSSGFLLQPGSFAGTVRVGTQTVEVSGSGFRDRIWGVYRGEPSADGTPGLYAVSFGEELSVAHVALRLRERLETESVVWRHGERRRATESSLGGPRSLDLDLADEGGERYLIVGERLAEVPHGETEPALACTLARLRWGTREAVALVERSEGERRT